MIEKLLSQLARHEGFRPKVYLDSVGKKTIGIGRNLDDVGISLAEARHLLNNDVSKAVSDLKTKYPAYNTLDDVRKAVLINMCFNMGWGKLSEFKNTLNLIAQGKYGDAASNMLKSKWATQVGNRAVELAEQMRTGEWQQ